MSILVMINKVLFFFTNKGGASSLLVKKIKQIVLYRTLLNTITAFLSLYINN